MRRMVNRLSHLSWAAGGHPTNIRRGAIFFADFIEEVFNGLSDKVMVGLVTKPKKEQRILHSVGHIRDPILRLQDTVLVSQCLQARHLALALKLCTRFMLAFVRLLRTCGSDVGMDLRIPEADLLTLLQTWQPPHMRMRPPL